MLEMIEATSEQSGIEAIWADVLLVAQRIPPLWDLKNYVAVNPFLGFSSTPIEQATRQMADGLGARVVPGLGFYQQSWRRGDFAKADLARAAARLDWALGPLVDVLDGRDPSPSRLVQPLLTLAEDHDRLHGTSWDDAIGRQITRWCAVHALGGGAYWGLPVKGRGLYASWREAASADRTLEVLGLSGWRRFVDALPGEADEAVTQVLGRLDLEPGQRLEYLYRLLGRVYGWASFFRRESWAKAEAEPLAVAELLVIRACADAAVAELAPRGRRACVPTAEKPSPRTEDESVLLVYQEALEDGFARRLIGGLNRPSDPAPVARPSVQTVFCIDVRSEPLRRHLEAQDDSIETRGFAGFFGVAMNWQAEGQASSARCPVLLKPTVTLQSPATNAPGVTWSAAKQLQGAPAGAFNFVEVLGLTYGLGLVADSLALRSTVQTGEWSTRFSLEPARRNQGISLPARVDLAAGILKNMGLRYAIARLVLLCGHQGRSANNPHAAGLDCGACGGHGGALNARVAAALLNDPAVRQGLRERGWALPEDTLFLAGVHETTTDQVTLFDVAGVPPSHQDDLRRLRGWLDRAEDLTRAERAPALGLADRPKTRLGRWLRRRSRDWSEVRPEWGLARNAAFLAARRSRTRGVHLHGRAFLHDYDASLDPDDSVLTLILTAPVVVAAWINLQYFASTVDNHILGCGNKTLHNRVGSLGVVLGNGGDLRTGLPIQSVHAPDGSWFHEPLRLQVIVETSPSRLDAVLLAQPAVRDLVDNGWIRLFALEPEGTAAHLRLRSGAWEPVSRVPASPG